MAAILFVTIIGAGSLAQTRRPAPPPAKTPAPVRDGNDLLAALPPADALALIKLRQLLVESIPGMLAENPGKLAEANTEVEKFKTKTGIDPRAVEQLAMGMRYTYPRAGVTKVETIGLARGAFNTTAIAAAGKIATPGKYREEKYRGSTIYIFTLDQQLKLFGLLNFTIHELALSPLESNLLAFGSPSAVRGALDHGKTRTPGNAELIALANQNPNALIGFSGNVTPQLLRNLKLDNEAIAKDVSTIRQVYGTAALSEKNLELFLAARTTDAASAKSLGETLEGLSQLAGLFVGRLPAPRRAAAQTALNNLKITAEGNELRVTTAVAQTQLGGLLR